MSSPYIGEIRMFGGSFAPAGWAFCSGQLLAISENDTLFQLIGTTYGGDGQSTFALPDLRGCLPVHQGTQGGIPYIIGEKGGTETVTLTSAQTPSHTHAFIASTNQGTLDTPSGNVLAASNVVSMYTGSAANSTLDPASMLPAGGSQPHDNMQPYLCVSFIISLFGIFPTQ